MIKIKDMKDMKNTAGLYRIREKKRQTQYINIMLNDTAIDI